MFTGLVANACSVVSVDDSESVRRLNIALGELSAGLETGASVAINGVCLTVAMIDDGLASFDVVPATVSVTNLDSLHSGSLVNVERSLRIGDEIGGHLVSGHVCTTASVVDIELGDNRGIEFEVPIEWSRYMIAKGFIALNGVSLTLDWFDTASRRGRVNLIPETLQRTTLGGLEVGDHLNVEIDAQTLATVNTVERYLDARSGVAQSES
ncbi:MAG: riboflavin synthase subunit alpha [Gammaproteobacteria bacterium]|nr:riboflavin synthase subunit alpha [Gammaproteobacteria bacterium]